MKRYQVYVDDVEAAAVAQLAASDDRSESAMLRRLIAEAITHRLGRPASSAGHEFVPQPGNALKCDVCGQKKAGHE